MITLVILATIVGLPILLALLFRVNAIFLFLGVATGVLLAQYISDDTSLVIDSFFSRVNVDQYVKLILLLLPVVLTLLFLRKTMNSSQLLLHLVPIILTSIALATLVVGYLPGGVQHNLDANRYGHLILSAQNVAIAAASLLTLILAWLTGGHKSKAKHH